ncbi:MAG: hypothetical protein JNL80_17275 [Phycisphaerae bacterium]|jgi:hypothetical protein|nr:hypothetical protein [Phycisphaerae bacterium]
MHWRANLLMLRSPQAIVGFLLLSLWPLAFLLAALWLIGFLGGRGGAPHPLLGGQPLGIAAGVATLVGFLFLQHIAFSIALVRTYAPCVRKAIRESGVPICLGCGQLLHAPDAASCPECGIASDAKDASGGPNRR